MGDLEDSISFQAEIRLMDTAFDEKALHYINLKYAGMFKGATQAREKCQNWYALLNLKMRTAL